MNVECHSARRSQDTAQGKTAATDSRLSEDVARYARHDVTKTPRAIGIKPFGNQDRMPHSYHKGQLADSKVRDKGQLADSKIMIRLAESSLERAEGPAVQRDKGDEAWTSWNKHKPTGENFPTRNPAANRQPQARKFKRRISVSAKSFKAEKVRTKTPHVKITPKVMKTKNNIKSYSILFVG